MPNRTAVAFAIAPLIPATVWGTVNILTVAGTGGSFEWVVEVNIVYAYAGIAIAGLALPNTDFET